MDNKNQNTSNLLLAGHTAQVLKVSYNQSTSILASASIDRNILIWKTPDYQNTAALKSHTNAVTSLAWTYSDKLISCSADKNIATWDIQLQKVIRKHKGHTAIVHDVATPKKTLEIIASVGDDGCMRLWDYRQKQQLQTVITKYPLVSAQFSLNGQKLYVGGIDNLIHVFNVKENKFEESISGHQDTISSLALSPDGTYLLSNSFDQTIRIWDTRNTTSKNKRLVKTLSGHSQGNQKGLLRADWSRDGLYIACGSVDKCVYIWDTTTKKIVQKLGGHTGTVNAVSFGKDNYLSSCSNDRNVLVSQLPDIFL